MSDTTVISNRPKNKPIVAGEKLRGAEQIACMSVKSKQTLTPFSKSNCTSIGVTTGKKLQTIKQTLRESKRHTVCNQASRANLAGRFTPSMTTLMPTGKRHGG